MSISNSKMDDALTSMLRTDYIPLRDTEKLQRLREYYVDYMGYIPQLLGENDQLIVGRRGTGKTTLFYRALVECMRSWKKNSDSVARPRTLGIYLDLNKCQSFADVKPENFIDFEHVFITELCEVIKEELGRSWPSINTDASFFSKLFRSAEAKRVAEVRGLVAQLAEVLKSGIPRLADRTAPTKIKTTIRQSSSTAMSAKLNSVIGDRSAKLQASVDANGSVSDGQEYNEDVEETVTYRLTVSDIIRILGLIRDAAEISCIVIFIDEFSALSEDLQRRFTTLIKKFIGNHQGIFIKIGAITDNYTLGSSIILQRDLFELPLDLDAFVERSGSLGAAMTGLSEATSEIVRQRLRAYLNISPDELFEDVTVAWDELSRAAMGVPRTLGIVLRHAWTRTSQANRRKISRSDIEYGIRAASKAYYKQLEGAARDGLAVPRFVFDMWDELITRASSEKSKISSSDASHFMVLVRNQERLRYLNMFFLIHLLTDGRTTKKERLPRGLYCFDYGICLENNLGFALDKNIIRQQRFAYDDIMKKFDKYFGETEERKFKCPQCGSTYLESQLFVAGKRLNFCPADKTNLVELGQGSSKEYTEEEVKIIGSIRSAAESDRLGARIIADDVGCYVQKVAKFGEKLDRARIVSRKRIGSGSYIYFDLPTDNS